MLIDPGTEFFELGTLAGFSLPYGDIPTAGMVSGEENRHVVQIGSCFYYCKILALFKMFY